MKKKTRMKIWRLFSSTIVFSRLRSRAPVEEFTNLRGRLAPFFSKVCPAKYVQIFKICARTNRHRCQLFFSGKTLE